jgi:formylglycine-generating enzyme required for sulfatase activity/uncharacterized caspase-like protein
MRPLSGLIILALVFASAGSQAQTSEPRLALIMGVGNYEGTKFQSLPGINHDLRRMKEAVAAAGFQVTVIENPTLSTAEDAIETFGAKLKAQAGGVGLFYFSGHGGEFEGRNYLIPKGARIVSGRDIKEQAVAAQRVLNRMEDAGARVNIVFLDCCRNDLTKAATDSGLAPMSARGTFIGFATGTDKTSAASVDGSPYTTILAKRLLTPGISILDMHTQVTADVEDITRDGGAPQTPFQYSGLRSNFFFVSGSGKDRVVVPTSTPAVPEARMAAASTPAPPATTSTPAPGFFQRLFGGGRSSAPASTPMPTEVAKLESAKPSGMTPQGRPGTPAGATKDAPFVNSLGMEFVPVPIVGGPSAGKRILFCRWETRMQDYNAILRSANRPNLDPVRSTEHEKAGFVFGATHPAVNVSKDELQFFCNALTVQERKEGRISNGDRYRLPTDHEWSCAVGIGPQEDANASPEEKDGKIEAVFPWGTTWPPPQGAGNFGDEQAKAKKSFTLNSIAGYDDRFPWSAPVGSFAPNIFGLYDMAGNVDELCEDNYHSRGGARKSGDGGLVREDVVLRGGSFRSGSELFFLSSGRGRMYPGGNNQSTGFRVVLEVAAP